MLQPKDTDWLNGLKKNKTHIYILSKRDPLQIQGHIQTESEEIEKNISFKLKSKESRSSHTSTRQKRLQNKHLQESKRLQNKDLQESKKDNIQ